MVRACSPPRPWRPPAKLRRSSPWAASRSLRTERPARQGSPPTGPPFAFSRSHRARGRSRGTSLPYTSSS
eukprot:617533-Alexandrium_andersonii.AAC.1